VKLLARLREWVKPRPKSAEDIAAAHEAARIRAEMDTLRSAQRGGAENYASQRRDER
jgi:hypothetical protein